MRFGGSDVALHDIAQCCTILHNIGHKEIVSQNDQGTGLVKAILAANKEMQRRASPRDSSKLIALFTFPLFIAIFSEN